MKKLMLILVVLAAMWQVCFAEDLPDTVWTRWMNKPTDVKLLPDDKSILCATLDGIIHVGIEGNIIDTIRHKTTLLEVFPDGKKIVFWNYTSIFIYDLMNKETIKTFDFDEKLQGISRVAPTKDGKHIIATIVDKKNTWEPSSYKIYVWNAETYQIEKIVPVNNWSTWNGGIVLDEKNEYFLISNYQYIELKGDFIKIVKWKIGTWEHEKDLYTFPKDINLTELAISPDCKYFAVGMYNEGSVEVFDYQTGQLLKRFTLESSPVISVCFSNNSKYLISGTVGNNWKIWNLENDKLLKTYNYVFRNINITKDSKYFCGLAGTRDWGGLALINSPRELTEVKENVQAESSIIFPNPATGEATIQFYQQEPGFTTIHLTNISGDLLKEVQSGFLDSGAQNININTSDLAIGNYFIQVRSRKLSLTFKLIIER